VPAIVAGAVSQEARQLALAGAGNFQVQVVERVVVVVGLVSGAVHQDGAEATDRGLAGILEGGWMYLRLVLGRSSRQL